MTCMLTLSPPAGCGRFRHPQENGGGRLTAPPLFLWLLLLILLLLRLLKISLHDVVQQKGNDTISHTH